jgi:hypothetical protein
MGPGGAGWGAHPVRWRQRDRCHAVWGQGPSLQYGAGWAGRAGSQGLGRRSRRLRRPLRRSRRRPGTGPLLGVQYNTVIWYWDLVLRAIRHPSGSDLGRAQADVGED